MIDINLAPRKLKKKAATAPRISLSRIDLQSLPLAKFGKIGIAALAAFQAALLMLLLIARLNLAVLEKRYTVLAPQKREIDDLKSQFSAMDKKVKAVDELMIRRLSWAKKLSDLSEAMTPDAWLTELSFGERTIERPSSLPVKTFKDEFGREMKRSETEKISVRYLAISGYVTSGRGEGAASIGKFIKSLKANAGFYADFRDIDVGAIKAVKFDDQEVMSFTVTCFFKETK